MSTPLENVGVQAHPALEIHKLLPCAACGASLVRDGMSIIYRLELTTFYAHATTDKLALHLNDLKATVCERCITDRSIVQLRTAIRGDRIRAGAVPPNDTVPIFLKKQAD